MFNERKEAVSKPLKPMLILVRQLRRVDLVCNHASIEVINLLAKRLKMTLLEPILLDRSKNGNEYIFDLDVGSKTICETVVAASCEEAWIVVAARMAPFGFHGRSIFLIDERETTYKPKAGASNEPAS